mmetsp:Transcript_19080/g.44155  ORF Transcript_19080/g.44155 Transcript_19080/m.44155 type:complete len:201 (-) Transcript_19080:1032-1634(-)
MTAEESCEFRNLMFSNRFLERPVTFANGPIPEKEHVSIQRMSMSRSIWMGSLSIFSMLNPPQKTTSLSPDSIAISIAILKSLNVSTSTHFISAGIARNMHKLAISMANPLFPVTVVAFGVGISDGGLAVAVGLAVVEFNGFDATIWTGASVGGSTGLFVIGIIGGLVGFSVATFVGCAVGGLVGFAVGDLVGFAVGVCVG